jgi:NAD-dependent SIR2 family protein deacetylase
MIGRLSLRRKTMSDFFGRLKSGANKVAFEADKIARLNRAQGEAEKIKSQINGQFSKLGEMVYEKFSKQEAVDPALVEACQAIAQLHQQAELKDEEIAKIKAETFNASAAAPTPTPAQTPAVQETAPVNPAPQAQPEVKHCPNCGKQVEPDEKFCKDCGTKL